MPLVKPISGRTKSVAGLRRYLEGADGRRALAVDLINLTDRGRDGAVAWDRVMDETRRAFGNDRPAQGGRAARTFMHYVISPDPRDRVSLEDLRALVCEWVREWFGDYEVAVVYHDDNTSNVMHAHVVVNNTNLETGRRISPYLTARRVRLINQSAQEMALERGWRAYSHEHKSLTAEEMAQEHTGIDRDGSLTPGPARSGVEHGRAASWRSRAETELRARGGTSWKEEVRQRVAFAAAVSRTTPEFLATCRALGLNPRESTGRRRYKGARAEWVFEHPDNPPGGARRVSGRRLGSAYSRSSLEHRFALGYRRARQAWRAAGGGRGRPLTDKERELIIAGVRSSGVIDGRSGVTFRDVCAMLDFNSARGVTSLGDYDSLSGPAARRAREVAVAIGAFGEGAERRTRRARSDARIVLDWMRDRDTRGEGGLEAACGPAAAQKPARDRVARDEARHLSRVAPARAPSRTTAHNRRGVER